MNKPNAPAMVIKSAQFSATEKLAQFASGLRWEDIPPEVIHEAKRAILDCHGVAFAGSQDSLLEKMRSVYIARAGAPEATLVGYPKKLDILSATLLNGTAAHALDFDDTHADFFYHATVPVAPVVWALGELQHASGRDLLTAFVAGWEVGARIARALYPGIYLRGWQGTATIGNFAAAAAAGRLLELTLAEMRNAFGLAGAQAGGTRQMLGTMSKPFQVGKSAMNGLLSALLSKEGVSSSPIVLEAPLGFAALTSPTCDFGGAMSDLGDRFELLRNTYKPYACCLKHHAVVDAFLKLINENKLSPDRLLSASCAVCPTLLDTANVTEPVTGSEGKFSVQHSAAVALTDRQAGLAQYTDQRVQDQKLAEVRRKLQFVADPEVAADECRLTAECADGNSYSVHIQHAQGGIFYPLSDDALKSKFRLVVGSVSDASAQDRAMEAILSLDVVNDVSAITALW